jgi:hypothetical protein
MSQLKTPMDGDYLNDFHREWNERCMKENARVQATRYTAEQARAQCQRMKELVRKEKEELRKSRKKS